jgi:hypothetical protein
MLAGMNLLRRASLLGLLVTTGCSGGGGETPDATPGPSGAGCPLTLRVDGVTYNATSCVVQGAKTFASGLYKINISAPFNTAATATAGAIRSVSFVLNDDDAATATHVRTFTVSAANPGATATYRATQTDAWVTLSDPMTNIGSGSFTVTEYDRTNKRISGSYEITVKQGSASKTISGTLTRVAMAVAE